MADEADKSTNTSTRPQGMRVSLMPWNNTSASAPRAIIAIFLIIAVPFLAVIIYSFASKGHHAKPDTSSAQPK